MFGPRKTRRGVMMACVLAGALMCSSLCAGERGVQELFSSADANGDGRLSAAEHRRYLELTFNQDDTNGDGGLDRRELAQSMTRSSHNVLAADSPRIQYAIASSFPMMDKDGNGRISKQESMRFAAQSFAASDSNVDSFLSLAEMLAKTPGH